MVHRLPQPGGPAHCCVTTLQLAVRTGQDHDAGGAEGFRACRKPPADFIELLFGNGEVVLGGGVGSVAPQGRGWSRWGDSGGCRHGRGWFWLNETQNAAGCSWTRCILPWWRLWLRWYMWHDACKAREQQHLRSGAE